MSKQVVKRKIERLEQTKRQGVEPSARAAEIDQLLLNYEAIVERMARDLTPAQRLEADNLATRQAVEWYKANQAEVKENE